MLSKLSRGTSAVDRQAHNLEAGGSIPPPATKMPRSSNGRAAPLHGADGSSILSRGTKVPKTLYGVTWQRTWFGTRR